MVAISMFQVMIMFFVVMMLVFGAFFFSAELSPDHSPATLPKTPLLMPLPTVPAPSNAVLVG